MWVLITERDLGAKLFGTEIVRAIHVSKLFKKLQPSLAELLHHQNRQLRVQRARSFNDHHQGLRESPLRRRAMEKAKLSDCLEDGDNDDILRNGVVQRVCDADVAIFWWRQSIKKCMNLVIIEFLLYEVKWWERCMWCGIYLYMVSLGFGWQRFKSQGLVFYFYLFIIFIYFWVCVLVVLVQDIFRSQFM